MFQSKIRPVVIPQSEHLKLVGTLALLWGNPDFDLPPVERLSMVSGMAFHDRGYGYIDNSPIGAMSDDEWELIARRGFYTQYLDATADLIAKNHFRRLARGTETAQRLALTAEFTKEIDQQLSQHRFSAELLERIDRITNFCDQVSYNFCFELPASGQVSIFPRNDSSGEVSVHYQVMDGRIRIEPWPLSVESYLGYIVGFKQDGYPTRLDPVIIPFELSKA